MNFEVHNIKLQNRVNITNAVSTTSLYVTNHREKGSEEVEIRKHIQEKAEMPRHRKLRRRAYEIPLL